jgi:LacI family transcriptional regulator
VATVSKVINQRADVAAATRERVEQVIAEHGYVVSRAGRSLRTGRSRQIDFVVQGLYGYYALEILHGVEEALASTDVRAVLASTHDHLQREQQWVRRVAEGSTDGAILVLADSKSAHLQELRRRDIPFVVVDRMGELGPGDLSVTATNWAGGKAATDYLLSLGHRRIGYAGGRSSAACNQARQHGYLAAMDAAGAVVPPGYVRTGRFRYDDGVAAGAAVLELPEPPTAVFAASDDIALGVVEAARVRGLHVPAQLSVVGFDDTQLARMASPPLTTVRQPLRQMGGVALRTALRLAGGERLDSHHVELATELVVRGSTAPPPRTAPDPPGARRR